MKKHKLKLTTEESESLKLSCIDFLKSCCQEFPAELEELAMQPGALTPRRRPENYMLQEPGMTVTEAHYLKKGIAILFTIDSASGAPKVFHIWEPEMMIVLFREFEGQLPNEDYYIVLAADAEIVSISNKCLETVYTKYPVVHEIAKTVMSVKKARMKLQMEILLVPAKLDRRQLFNEKFPKLRGLLSIDYLCGFLSVSRATLSASR